MKTEKVLTKNATYQKFEVLKTNRNKRYKYKEFFVEGVRNINEAIKNNWLISSFLYSRQRKLSSWAEDILSSVKTDINYELTEELMSALSDKEDTSELLAIVKMRKDSFDQFKLSSNPVLVLFDRPSNRGNLGTILRSCDALGVEGLIMTGHAVDLYDPEVIVSSMGSFFHIPAIRVNENSLLDSFILELRSKYQGFQIIGTTAHKQYPIDKVDLTKPTMFLIGNETDGLSNRYKEICDILTTIPMAESSSATSFNVGCAATVLFYEATRQRRSLTAI